MNESDPKISEREQAIRQKVEAGLRREQAEQVVTAQEAHDAELARQAEAEAKAKKK